MTKAINYTSGAKAWAIVLVELLLTALAIYLSLLDAWIPYIGGQLLLGLVILHWFLISHDLVHNSFFPNATVNRMFGFFASLFTLIPYYSWKYFHLMHHSWTGWKDKDPTHVEVDLKNEKAWKIKMMDFCWKYWVPIFAMSFAIRTFWSMKRLKQFGLTERRVKNSLISIWFVVLVHLLLIMVFGLIYLKVFIIPMLIFMSISDPLLLSQHAHIDHFESGGEAVKAFKSQEQAVFSRTLVYPKWVGALIFFNFNEHGMHHKFPQVPSYALSKLGHAEENSIHWLKWLKLAKSMPAHILIFKSSKETGIKL